MLLKIFYNFGPLTSNNFFLSGKIPVPSGLLATYDGAIVKCIATPSNIIQLNINTEKKIKSYTSTCEPCILAPTCSNLQARSAASVVIQAAFSIAYVRVMGPGGSTATASTPSA